MSRPLSLTFAFYRDLITAMLALIFGRLFPTLHVPHRDLTHKTAIITGGNSGIGLEIAIHLAQCGATIYLACRSASKAASAVSEITSRVPSSAGRIHPLSLDTSSRTSIHAFAQQWASRTHNNNNPPKIDLLYHNAGIASSPPDQRYTPDDSGLPLIYATNLLGSFLLTHLLEPHLAPDARIIFTSSTGQFGGSFSRTFSLTTPTAKNSLESGFHAPRISPNKDVADEALYANTKLMQVAFATLLQRRFDRQAKLSSDGGLLQRKERRRLAHAFSPGFTLTPIMTKTGIRSAKEDPIVWALKATAGVLATEPGQGAATGKWLAVRNEGEGEGGGYSGTGRGKGSVYWHRMAPSLSKVDIMDGETVERLWVRWEADAGVEWR